jgi:Domain of unknown function (DUF4337)
MGHGAEQHMEHAEHAQHAAHNPFDRTVTVTIAVVAAILAGVSLAGHRAHNDTLLFHGEAIKEHSLVGIYRTDAANQYAFYQSKKNRETMYEAFSDFVSMLTLKEGTEEHQKKILGNWKKQADKYKMELPEMLEKAKKKEEQANEHEEKAEKAVKASHTVHMEADRFDLGELALQFGVVLCSMAILTKGRGFWYSGMLCSAVGLLVALSGFFRLFMDEGGHH